MHFLNGFLGFQVLGSLFYCLPWLKTQKPINIFCNQGKQRKNNAKTQKFGAVFNRPDGLREKKKLIKKALLETLLLSKDISITIVPSLLLRYF